MDLKELRKQYAGVIDEMNAVAEGAQKENRGLSAEELGKFEELEKKAEGIKRSIEAAERLEKLNEERAQATSKSVDIQVTRNEGEDEKGECRVWGSMGEQLMAVKRMAIEPVSFGNTPEARKLELSNRIMRAATGMQESVMAEGGFLIQQNFAQKLIERAQETGKLAGRVDKYSLSAGNSITFPSVDETSRADGSRTGGVQAYWEGEADTYTKSKPKFGKIDLKLKKLTGLCYLTDELLEDVPVLESFVSRAFAKEFGFKIDDAIIRGNGAGKPFGFLNSPALVTQDKESSQTADTINAQNIAKMLARLHEEDLAGAVWVYNPGAKAQLMTLALTIGSNSYPVFLQGGVTGNFVNGVPVNTVLGLPAFAMEQCSALGDLGDIMLFNPSKYIWIDKGGVKAAQSIHVSFEKSETAFRFVYRADGQPAEKSALTPYKGSDTFSSHIALQAR